ncbi:uncharacterized protein LOC117169827 [Belonocnema kinseyi]|uniref:uncharacterized protein LOC117169827 n=1 Tax=Belonocnema kinseyi TaxID=2817044 RepID=UPI00143CD0CC|nr:uncharacterized protein LOC117169827 [Belonocnema kinseyi]
MQIFSWLYLVASLKIVASKMEPIGLTSREEEIVSPIFSYLRKSELSRDEDGKPLSFLDLNDFNSKSPTEDLEFKNYENLQLEDLDASIEDDANTSEKQMENAKFLQLSAYLKKLLQQPGSWTAPLVLIDQPLQDFDNSLNYPELENQPAVKKRSRYYRRYPWKRKNASSRSAYDYNNTQYLCTPSKKEVYELLVALHSARQGSKPERLHFCNRHRQPGIVFSNLRFLGRRK